MFKIENEKDLYALLKNISKKTINESNIVEKDPFIDKFNSSSKKQKSLSEQEEPEEEPAEEPAEDEDEDSDQSDNIEDEVDEEEGDDKMNPAAKKALSLPSYSSDQEVTFDQILTAINLVRAGNSTNAKETKQEIKDYFERLDKEEKGVLIIYLKELAKIMTGAIDGDEAQDPSDPTAYFDIIVKKDQEEDNKAENKTDSQAEEGESKPVQKEPQQKSGIEDTTPPIKVNEAQDFTEIRRKIRLINS